MASCLRLRTRTLAPLGSDSCGNRSRYPVYHIISSSFDYFFLLVNFPLLVKHYLRLWQKYDRDLVLNGSEDAELRPGK
jgi:hypothetical protein